MNLLTRVCFSFFLLCFISCTPEEEKASIHVDQLLSGFGLKSNVFHTEPEEQFGTIIFYQSPRVVERLAKEVGFEGPTHTAVQIQGKLAQEILSSLSYFYKGTIKVKEPQVIFLFGEISDDLHKDFQDLFTIDDVYYFEGKEIIVVGGTEAVSFVELAKNKFSQYFSYLPQKTKRVFFASYGEAASWVRDLAFTFYDDLKVVFTTNPLLVCPFDTTEHVLQIPSDVSNFSLQGAGKVVLLTGYLWVISFDSLSRFSAYLSGSELIPESVLLRKTIKSVGDVGYLVSDSVSQIFTQAGGEKSGQGILLHPWISIDITSEALRNVTGILTTLTHSITEIGIGYISDNLELLGEFLNLMNKSAIGGPFIFVAESVVSSLKITCFSVKAVVYMTGGGLSALVGSLSVTKPMDVKIVEFKIFWKEDRSNFKSIWHEFLKLIGIR